MRARNRRILRNYLLNARYQLRFTAVILVLSAALTGSIGFFVMSNAHEASRVMQVRAMDHDGVWAQQLLAQLQRNDRSLLIILVSFGLVLCLVLTGYGIVLTHHVAGPLYKIANHFDQIRDDRLAPIDSLRKGDELLDFFEHFMAAHNALRARTEEDIVLYERAIDALAGNPLAEELHRARAKKQESLG